MDDVDFNNEIHPRRPDYVGEYARYCHCVHEMTDTGYTSWTTDRDTAVELAQYASREAKLSGRVVVFRVRLRTIAEDRLFEGVEAEDECLIEGTVENVEFSEDADDEYD